MTKQQLDEFDRKILSALQENARISNVELAKLVGLSPTPCCRRVQRLEAAGIIERYVAILSAKSLGAGVSVFVDVRLNQQTSEVARKFERAVALRPEITECHLVTGDSDYLLRIRIEDVDRLRDFIRDYLLTLPGVMTTSSRLVLESPKQALSLPLTPI